jgi:hypothetical protein
MKTSLISKGNVFSAAKSAIALDETFAASDLGYP